MALIDSLQAYWKFDESSGNAADATGNGYTLTNNNTVSYGTALINNGADYGSANTNKYFYSSGTAGVSVDTALSFAGWVNITTAPGSGDAYDLLTLAYTSNDVFYAIEYVNFSGTLRLRAGRARAGVDDPTLLYTQTLTTGTWFHIAYTIDGSRNQNLYVNGSNVVNNTAVSGSGTFNLTTGTYLSQASFGGRYLSGKMDEWGVWSKELTSGEVTELYNSGAGLAYPFATTKRGAVAAFF